MVTNQGWDDFWLNEGFTVYVERQIISKKFGRETKHFHYHLGYKSMVDEIERYGPTHEFTKLVPRLVFVENQIARLLSFLNTEI